MIVAFGPEGPRATAKQISYLEALLEKAGYAGFRDARRAFGLSQRQAGGRFTRQEASELIDRLVNGESALERDRSEVVDPVEQTRADLVRGLPAQVLADELARRGWSVQPPG